MRPATARRRHGVHDLLDRPERLVLAVPRCTRDLAGSHTVTGERRRHDEPRQSLTVTAGALDHLALSPASATIAAGGSQAYTAEGRDQYDNSLGDVTSTTTFSIAPNGSCTVATCTATSRVPTR